MAAVPLRKPDWLFGRPIDFNSKQLVAGLYSSANECLYLFSYTYMLAISSDGTTRHIEHAILHGFSGVFDGAAIAGDAMIIVTAGGLYSRFWSWDMNMAHRAKQSSLMLGTIVDVQSSRDARTVWVYSETKVGTWLFGKPYPNESSIRRVDVKAGVATKFDVPLLNGRMLNTSGFGLNWDESGVFLLTFSRRLFFMALEPSAPLIEIGLDLHPGLDVDDMADSNRLHLLADGTLMVHLQRRDFVGVRRLIVAPDGTVTEKFGTALPLDLPDAPGSAFYIDAESRCTVLPGELPLANPATNTEKLRVVRTFNGAMFMALSQPAHGRGARVRLTSFLWSLVFKAVGAASWPQFFMSEWLGLRRQ